MDENFELEKNALRLLLADGTRVAVTCGEPACTETAMLDAGIMDDTEVYVERVTTFGGRCEACGGKLLK